MYILVKNGIFMIRDLENSWNQKLFKLKKEVTYLADNVNTTERIYSGLKDITQTLKLTNPVFRYASIILTV